MRSVFAFLTVWLCVGSLPCTAQYFRSQVSGFVRDASEAVVPGAAVTLEAPAVAMKRSTKTDNSGFYIFPDLPMGQYQISVEAAGFKKYTKTGIGLDSATRIVVDVTLEVGAVTESVQVSAALEQVELGTGEVSRVLTDKQLTEIAIPGRNVMSLTLLLPGMISRNGIIEDRGTSYSAGGWFLMGLRKHFNYMTVDGLSNMMNHTLILYSNNIGPDFLEEFKVSTSAYAPEYGRSVGVQMNAVTKRGTRDFHGTVFEFVRNDKLRARSAFEGARKSPYRFNNYGWTVGGPVYIPGKFNSNKDKLFFFVGQEFRRVRSPALRVGIVPTAEERAGNFSGSVMRTPIDPDTKAPFPGNIISAARISSNGRAIAGIYPLPNFGGPGGNHITGITSRTNRSSNIARLDFVPTPKWNASLRVIYDLQDEADPFGVFAGTIPIQGWRRRNPAYNGQFTLQTIVNPSTINEFSVGYSGIRMPSTAYPEFATRERYGITFREAIPGNVGNMIPSRVDVSGLSFLGVALAPFGSGSPSYHWRNNFSKIVGRHSLKFGVYFEHGGHNRYSRANDSGSFSFNASPSNPRTSGNGLADLLLGNFDSYSEAGTAPYNAYRYQNYELYAQDSWKMLPNLTVEYGTRYSIWPPYYHAYNSIAAWHPKYYDPAKAPQMNPNGTIVPGTGDLYNGVVLPGDGFTDAARGRVPQVGDREVERLFRGLPRGYSETLKGGFGPRLGFSWDPFSTGKLAIRGGIALVQGRSDMEAIFLGMGDFPPFATPTITITNGPLDDPARGVPVALLLFPQSFRVLDLKYKNPSVVNWHFSVQRELPGQIIADVGYVGNQSSHNSRGRPLNFLPPERMKELAGRDLRPYLPYRGLDSLYSAEPSSSSSYNSLQVRVSRRFKDGLLFNASYTVAKAIGDAHDRWDGPQNPLDIRAERGYNEDDRRHVLVIHSIYELPFFKGMRGLPGYVLKGWQISATAVFNSGRHFNPGLTGAPNQIAARPDVVGRAAIPKSEKTLRRFFNTGAFARPAAWTFGNAGRNILVGPGTNNWDIMIAKNTRIRERVNVQFRCESFNFFNHPSYNGINTALGSAAFGQVTGVNAGRVFQLGMKVVF
ncbi:MAG: carboxypeptidase-like regulatory domain-containing protein [Acidobacteriota bacterium]